MTAGRLYCIQSWNNASETSGEQIGNRLAQSRGLHFNRDGSANVDLYSEGDDTSKRKTSIPLSDRILPQKKRLNTLRNQLIELETEYKTTGMSIEEYSTLRDILMVKISRAEVLYKKAISVRPHTPQNIDEIEEFGVEYDTHNSVTEGTCGVAWVDELSPKNSFKKMLQNTCKASRTLVKCYQRAKAYYQELKEV
jgi:hypothetical protein